MLFLKKRQAKKELETLLFEMQQYLANNYKDLAHECREKLGQRTEELVKAELIDEKTARKYRQIYTEYTARLHGYGH